MLALFWEVSMDAAKGFGYRYQDYDVKVNRQLNNDRQHNHASDTVSILHRI